VPWLSRRLDSGRRRDIEVNPRSRRYCCVAVEQGAAWPSDSPPASRDREQLLDFGNPDGGRRVHPAAHEFSKPCPLWGILDSDHGQPLKRCAGERKRISESGHGIIFPLVKVIDQIPPVAECIRVVVAPFLSVDFSGIAPPSVSLFLPLGGKGDSGGRCASIIVHHF